MNNRIQKLMQNTGIVFGACTVVMAGLLSLQVSAQEFTALEEVIVTATRRSESLQEMGETVSAFTDEAMDDRHIRIFSDLNNSVSSLDIATYNGESSVFLRGIGTPIIIAGNDSSVGTYLDGVFLSRGAAIGPAFFDIERVEVLKGPQGTLYGRNATGGAINIITKGPTDEFSAEARATMGNYDRFQFFGAVSGPFNERIKGRLAIQYEDRDGYTTGHLPRGSLAASQPDQTIDLEDKDDVALRAKLEFALSADASFTMTGDYYKANDRAMVWHYGSAGYQDEVPGWLGTREGASAVPYFLFKGTGRASQPKSRDIFVDAPFSNKTEIWGITGDLDWNIQDYNVQLIGNYKDSNPDMHNEFDLSDAYVNLYHREEDHWQWSMDAQITSPADNRFQWIAGGYYFEEKNKVTNDAFGDFWEPILTAGLDQLIAFGVIPPIPTALPASNLCCDLGLNGEQETRAWAVFIDTSFELTKDITLKVGGRYSREQRDGAQAFDLSFLPASPGGDKVRFAPNPLLFPLAISDSRDGVVNDPFGFVVAPNNGPKTFSAFTPKFGIDYSLNENVLLYGNVQRGFKSGGYNIGSGQRDTFAPEKIWSYEAGIKSDLFSQRLRMNLAYFHYDYTNLQAQDAVSNQPQVRNVGKARVDGVEGEIVFRATDQFQVDGTFTWLDTRFTEGTLTEPSRPAPLTDPAGSLVRDLKGLEFIRAPDWKYNLGAQFDQSLGDLGELIVRLDYSWRDKVYVTVFNIDAGSEESYGLLGARARLAGHDGHWAVTVFGENLTDEKYFSNQIISGAAYGGEFIGTLGAPRTYGVELSYQY